MTQYGYEPLSPEDSGSILLERINGVVPALLTNHKGAARPGYVQPGMLWIDDSGATWLLNLYDGTNDVSIATINPVDHTLTLAGFSELYGKAAFRADGTPGAPVIYGPSGQIISMQSVVDGAAGTVRRHSWQSGGKDRFAMYVNQTAEDGTGAGSDFGFVAYDDTGASLGSVFTVERKTRVTNFDQMPLVNGAALSSLFGGAVPKSVVEIAASGGYKPSAGTKFILAILRGGGGGAAGANGSSNGGGGGGEGAMGIALIPVDPATTYPVTIGAGGPSVPARNNGYAAGSTSIVAGGVTYLAGGGGGGYVDGTYGSGGLPGAACILGFVGTSSRLWRQMGATYGWGSGPSQAAGQAGSQTGGAGSIGHATILEFGS